MLWFWFTIGYHIKSKLFLDHLIWFWDLCLILVAHTIRIPLQSLLLKRVKSSYEGTFKNKQYVEWVPTIGLSIYCAPINISENIPQNQFLLEISKITFASNFGFMHYISMILCKFEITRKIVMSNALISPPLDSLLKNLHHFQLNFVIISEVTATIIH